MRLKIIYFSFAVAICLIACLIFRFQKQKKHGAAQDNKNSSPTIQWSKPFQRNA
jgi:hypothetical protein